LIATKFAAYFPFFKKRRKSRAVSALAESGFIPEGSMRKNLRFCLISEMVKVWALPVSLATTPGISV